MGYLTLTTPVSGKIFFGRVGRAMVSPVEFHGDLWRQKTRVPGVSCGVVCVILRFAGLVELRLVTDRHRHRPMASTADA